MQGVEPDQAQPGRRDQQQERPGGPHRATPRGQLRDHLPGAGEIGVGGAQREHDRGHRGGGSPARPDGQPEQRGERHVGACAPAETADRSGGQAQVEQGGRAERDAGDPGQLPGRVAEPGGQRGHSLPPHEGEHQGGGGPSNREPAIRGERRPVGRAGGGRGSGHGDHHHHDQQGDEHQLGERAGPDPAQGQAEHGEQKRGRHDRAHQLATADQLGDVARTDQAHDRGAADHAGQEAPACHRARPAAQAGRRVPGDAACRGHRAAQPGEHSREHRREPDQRGPGQYRCGPSLRRGQPGQQQQAGAEQRPDVERGASGDGQLRRSGDVCGCPGHACIMTENASHAISNVARIGPSWRNVVRQQ